MILVILGVVYWGAANIHAAENVIEEERRRKVYEPRKSASRNRPEVGVTSSLKYIALLAFVAIGVPFLIYFLWHNLMGN